MDLSIVFWVFMIILLFFGGTPFFRKGESAGPTWITTSTPLIILILIGMLGWRVFGPIVHN